MKRIFIDSSVLFSAMYSDRGHSRDLLIMAIRGEIQLVVSDLVLKEVEKNLAESAPEVLDVLRDFLELVPFEITNPSRQAIIEAARYVVMKDAPILAAAKMSKVDLLVTLDKKHLLGKPDLSNLVAIPIVTPSEAFFTLNS